MEDILTASQRNGVEIPAERRDRVALRTRGERDQAATDGAGSGTCTHQARGATTTRPAPHTPRTPSPTTGGVPAEKLRSFTGACKTNRATQGDLRWPEESGRELLLSLDSPLTKQPGCTQSASRRSTTWPVSTSFPR